MSEMETDHILTEMISEKTAFNKIHLGQEVRRRIAKKDMRIQELEDGLIQQGTYVSNLEEKVSDLENNQKEIMKELWRYREEFKPSGIYETLLYAKDEIINSNGWYKAARDELEHCHHALAAKDAKIAIAIEDLKDIANWKPSYYDSRDNECAHSLKETATEALKQMGVVDV